MLSDLKTSKSKVEQLLKTYPELRDNDKKLWIAYLNVYCNLASELRQGDPWNQFRNVIYSKDTPMPESIRRLRQKFQENGMYLGTKRLEKLEEAGEVRQWAIDN